ncbi:uncharacterized protein [Heterodontus francisci]|uniref:uncharacterized protein isoform X2 n=1 Tax=Heterodontus francisci TaxID=7792 RepID=UPI00355B13A4
MKPFALVSPSLSFHRWAHSEGSNIKKEQFHPRIGGSSQLLLVPGKVNNKAWNWGGQHLKPLLSPSRGKHFKQLSYHSTKVPASKNRPCYFTFVNSVRLWDREQSHEPPTLQPDSTRPSLPCPRFIAHMNTSSGALRSPWDLNSRPRTLQAGLSSMKLCASPRDTWKTAVYPRHQVTARSICHSSFKPNVKALPKSPPPCEAPLVEDEEKQEDIQREAGLGAAEQNQAEELESNGECGSSRVIWDVTGPDHPVMDEADRLRESFSPLVSGMPGTLMHCSRNTLSVCSQGTEFSLDRDTNQTEMQGRLSSWGGGSSTDLSQLRCSSISWNSRDSEDSELNTGSSSFHSDRNRLHKGSLLVASTLYQSMVNADLSVSSCHRASDPLQVSPSAVKGSPAERTPSFVEIWPNQVLKHWPVLPPISTQRGVSEAWSCGSPGQTVQSYSGLSAYEELDEIIPCTGSSLSHRTLDDTTEEVSDSDLTERSSASETPWTSTAHKSLAEIRLSLMDHQSWDHNRHVNQLEEHLAQTAIAGSLERIAKGETREMDRSGFPAHHLSGNSSECKPVYAQRNNEEDKHQNGHSVTSDTLYNKVATFNGLILSTRDSSRQCSSPVVSSLKKIALPEDVDHFISMDSSNMEGKGSPLPSVDRATQLNTELDSISSHVQSERTTEASQMSQIRRRTPPRLSRGVLVEMERVRQVQSRKAKALQTFEKLRATKLSGELGSETKNISNFEDFNFLEKYCIFNREELALYKKKFEEVDNDNDGYLSCVEVVMALKEMVPLGALTDSEEIYIYRVLESLDYHVIDGLTDFRLFAVMASLAQKIMALDGFMRSLIGNMDFKVLELRLDRAKQLFLCNLESESTTISVQQFLVELKAGGISRVHEEEVRKELQHTRALDLLDFLTYLPLFVLIHNSVVSNPLDDSRTL